MSIYKGPKKIFKRKKSELKTTPIKKKNTFKRWAKKSVLQKFSIGTILTLLITYWTLFPKDLEIEVKDVGKSDLWGPAFIVHNPNRYTVNNVHIECIIEVDVKFKTRTSVSSISGSTIINEYEFDKIESNKTELIFPQVSRGGRVIYIRKLKTVLVTKFKSPWFFPNKNADTLSFTGVLNDVGEVILLQD